MVCATKKSGFSWVTVNDFSKARTFFTEVLGLEVSQDSEEFGWMELKAEGGEAFLGVALHREGDTSGGPQLVCPGQNGVITFDVEDIEASKAQMESKGVTFHGDIVEVPGHVKMVWFTDHDNNAYQLCEQLT